MSDLGSDSVSVLRIISYFDALGESAANADTIVRSAALLAQCPVAARWAGGSVIGYDALGDPLVEPRPPETTRRDLDVWLDRGGADHPLDSVLLDRLRHTLRVAEAQSAVVRTGSQMGDPALLEVVLSDKERREDRLRAVQLLGLDPAQPVRVLAVSAAAIGPAMELITQTCSGRLVRSVAAGNLTAVLVQDGQDGRALAMDLHAAIAARYPTPLTPDVDRGPWVGVGERMSVYAAPGSWKQARRALRFASSTLYGRRAVAYAPLSSLQLLAELPLERLLNDPDVARLNALATSATGAQEVTTLEAFCAFGSLRRTAAELHVHHSTVAARLAHVEAEMGWDLEQAIDRFMATLVLMIRRMALTSTELAAAEVFGPEA
ncbi:PucR family transcriptional regulator [Rhodococcus olei]|uniref:PucR family transcriptional regulator n=2 Tax=Rhodococcus olei TaxID=2161675 RepID=A0ABP8PAV5_9NOCA